MWRVWTGGEMFQLFFSLEKYKEKQKTINRIKLSDGSYCSDSKTILEECRTFYKNLYSKNNNLDNSVYPEFFEGSSPKVDSPTKRLLWRKDYSRGAFTNIKILQ